MSKKCPVCEGRGEVLKKPNFHGSVCEAWLANANDMKPCKKCNGLGRLGLDLVKDILIEIRSLKAGRASALADRALEEFADAQRNEAKVPQ